MAGEESVTLSGAQSYESMKAAVEAILQNI